MQVKIILYYCRFHFTLTGFADMTGKKAWSGRFTEPTHPLVERFNASLSVDKRLYRSDIKGSIAHVKMLARQKIILNKESTAIVRGLKEVEREITCGAFGFHDRDEDIHMAVERRLTEIIGAVAGKLHTARSRNDQVATDFRMYVKEATLEITGLIRNLQQVFYKQAKKHIDTLSPSYTHLQPAQPIRLAHWFLAYYEMFDRDVSRFLDSYKRTDVMPLGSAALAGTNFPIDREWVASQLGFSAVSRNSLDAVADRDFAVEFLFCCSMTATHLSRLAEELVIFTSSEFSAMELPDAFCTGSSIMPQKKNPDVPELIRGKTGRFNGHLISLLTLLKGLPLAYNKDMQEDKEPLFDAHDQLVSILTLSADMLGALRVDKERLAKRSEQGFMTAVDVADRLVMLSVPFRSAHEIVGRLVRHCEDRGITFTDLTDAELKGMDPKLARIGVGDLTPESSADGKKSVGGTSRQSISARIKEMEKEMKKW